MNKKNLLFLFIITLIIACPHSVYAGTDFINSTLTKVGNVIDKVSQKYEGISLKIREITSGKIFSVSETTAENIQKAKDAKESIQDRIDRVRNAKEMAVSMNDEVSKYHAAVAEMLEDQDAEADKTVKERGWDFSIKQDSQNMTEQNIMDKNSAKSDYGNDIGNDNKKENLDVSYKKDADLGKFSDNLSGEQNLKENTFSSKNETSSVSSRHSFYSSSTTKESSTQKDNAKSSELKDKSKSKSKTLKKKDVEDEKADVKASDATAVSGNLVSDDLSSNSAEISSRQGFGLIDGDNSNVAETDKAEDKLPKVAEVTPDNEDLKSNKASKADIKQKNDNKTVQTISENTSSSRKKFTQTNDDLSLVSPAEKVDANSSMEKINVEKK